MPQPRTAESASTLDNPVWWALTGNDCRLSEGEEKARRYHAVVSPLAAVSDEHDPEAWAEMAGLAAGSPVAVITSSVPDGWTELQTLRLVQMVYTRAPGEQHPSAYEFTPLTRADVSEMLALVEQTKPGPFARSTIDLGGYRGWRADGELVCMAGERMHPGNWTEISAVCTAPGHQGRGLAASVVSSLVNDICAGGRCPFLNVTVEKVGARRLYEKLDFKERTQMTLRVLQPYGSR
ncbi:MAG TPA: GNAT family N-acetyltransferase [Streptosporangiaceae bacterium]